MSDMEKIENEEWRDIPGYEGYYQVSSLGRIKSLNRNFIRSNGWPMTRQERILKLGKNGKGYLFAPIHKNDKRKNAVVHRMMYLVFFEHKNDGRNQINHIDGNKNNNNLSNLELCNNSENQIHAYKLGLNKRKIGETNPLAKLNDNIILKIREEYKKLVLIKKHGARVILAKKYKVTPQNIGSIVNCKTWAHVR